VAVYASPRATLNYSIFWTIFARVTCLLGVVSNLVGFAFVGWLEFVVG
jgi:hypothetical protein